MCVYCILLCLFGNQLKDSKFKIYDNKLLHLEYIFILLKFSHLKTATKKAWTCKRKYKESIFLYAARSRAKHDEINAEEYKHVMNLLANTELIFLQQLVQQFV